MKAIGSGCKYPNIAEWMRREKMGYPQIARTLGVSQTSIYTALSRRGNSSKYIIDGILGLTGLTYEEAFWTPEGDGGC